MTTTDTTHLRNLAAGDLFRFGPDGRLWKAQGYGFYAAPNTALRPLRFYAPDEAVVLVNPDEAVVLFGRLEFPNVGTGITATITRRTGGDWFVTLRDDDADELLGSGRVYPTDRLPDAIHYARVVAGLAPSGEPLSVPL